MARLRAAAGRSSRLTARRRQAAAAKILPRLRIDSKSGLVPDAEGNVFNPPADTTGFRIPRQSWAASLRRAELQFVQPLYPISLARHLDEAATQGIDVDQSDLSQAQLDVAFAVKELYYGLLLAQDLDGLARRVSKELARRAEELDDDSALSSSDRYKLRLAQLDLAVQQREVGDQLALARAALAWRTSLPSDEPLLLQAERLAPVAVSVPPLDELVAQALDRRPNGASCKRASPPNRPSCKRPAPRTSPKCLSAAACATPWPRGAPTSGTHLSKMSSTFLTAASSSGCDNPWNGTCWQRM